MIPSSDGGIVPFTRNFGIFVGIVPIGEIGSSGISAGQHPRVESPSLM